MNLPPQERYQAKPFIGSSHSWAKGICADLPLTARVIDIGSGSGVMGKELRARGVAHVAAVEVDAAAREHGRLIYHRVENDLAAYSGETFDAALLLDVLEHIDEPEPFFDQVVSLVKPGGSILLSVPNIAHWSVRLSMLFGFFEYQDRGILDRTHRSFFTARRVERFITARPHLAFIERSASISPAQFVLPRWAWDNPVFDAVSELRLAAARALPGIGAYQHLAHIRVRAPGGQRPAPVD